MTLCLLLCCPCVPQRWTHGESPSIGPTAKATGMTNTKHRQGLCPSGCPVYFAKLEAQGPFRAPGKFSFPLSGRKMQRLAQGLRLKGTHSFQDPAGTASAGPPGLLTHTHLPCQGISDPGRPTLDPGGTQELVKGDESLGWGRGRGQDPPRPCPELLPISEILV